MVGDRRVAGAAAFYGCENPQNASWRVPGKQTAVRAELFAVLQVLRREQGPLSIRTDCRIVASGCTIWRHQWKAAAWFRAALKAQTIPHADLWREIDFLLEGRNHPCDVRWVKGHSLPRHVWQGATTEVDSWGNHEVDGMATEQIRELLERKA